jgi:hypothetical protein
MIQGRRGELSGWHDLDLERGGELHHATPLGCTCQWKDKGDDRGVLRAHAGRMELDVTPQHDGAGYELGGRVAEARARSVPGMDAAHAVVAWRWIRMTTAQRAACGVDAAPPGIVDEGRPQGPVVEAPLAVADHRLDEIRGACRECGGRVQHGRAGSRTGGGSRSGPRRGRSGIPGGCAGTVGGVCVGTRIGSTVIRRDGPGSVPTGSGANQCCMATT